MLAHDAFVVYGLAVSVLGSTKASSIYATLGPASRRALKRSRKPC